MREALAGGGMPFPTQPNMAKVAFRGLIVDHYWPDLIKKLAENQYIQATDKTALRNDYAEIGAFLSNKQRVYAALLPLETEIRKNLVANFPMNAAAAAPWTTRVADEGGDQTFKSGKLLSNALRTVEAEGGFNHEKLVLGDFKGDDGKGTLHAGGGLADRAGKVTTAGQGASNALKLPSGAPTVIGTLDPLAFQSVLLRHGYQFKDVAAGPYHGEFTHRLQWYAIMQAKAIGSITLTNTPLEICKSLGYMSAQATDKVPAGRHLWMWEALFDTGETPQQAERLKTAAVAGHGSVFTCPENLTKSLMNLNGMSSVNPSDLWCLRVLVKTRWKKRFDENDGVQPLDPRTGRQKLMGMPKLRQNITQTSAIVSTSFQEEKLGGKVVSRKDYATIDDAGYALVWYLRGNTGRH
jgi:hypothetical protein